MLAPKFPSIMLILPFRSPSRPFHPVSSFKVLAFYKALSMHMLLEGPADNVLLLQKRIDTEVVLLIARVGRLRPRYRPEKILVLPRRRTLLGAVAATVVGVAR